MVLRPRQRQLYGRRPVVCSGRRAVRDGGVPGDLGRYNTER